MTRNFANEARYDKMAKEAKALRAKARRLEAKGEYLAASEVREQVDGLRWEMQYLREHWS